MQAVWDHSRQDGNHLLVLLALADSANNDTFETWLKNETLARKARCSVRRVQEILARLVADGEVQVKYNQGPRRTNVYVIVLPGCGGCEKSQGAEVRGDEGGAQAVDKSGDSRERSQGAGTRRVRELAQEGAGTRTVGCGDSQGEGCDFSREEGAISRGKRKRREVRQGQGSWGAQSRRSVLDPSLDPLGDPSLNRRARTRDAPAPVVVGQARPCAFDGYDDYDARLAASASWIAEFNAACARGRERVKRSAGRGRGGGYAGAP